MWLSKTHIALRVEDACKSAAFYEALLGGPPTHRSARLAVFEFDSPPLVLSVDERPRVGRSDRAASTAPKPSGSCRDGGSLFGGHRPLALMVAEPQHVGDAAIRLRRAGVRLRVQDQGIEAHDPDGNSWRVHYAPSTPGRAVVVT